MNKRFLTDASRGALENDGWKFRAPENMILEITPPNTLRDIQAMPINWEGISGFNIIKILKLKTIDNTLHDSLLNESLRENEGLWRRLAKR